MHTVDFSFWFQFPLFCRFPRKNGFGFGDKVVSVFGFSFVYKKGLVYFCLLSFLEGVLQVLGDTFLFLEGILRMDS